LIQFVLHLDAHLVELLRQYGGWVYALLFLIVFAETGLVVTPFLPGDSLLFAAGAVAAIDQSHTLTAGAVSLVLAVAAILGNTVNYAIGRLVGPAAFSGRIRWLRVAYLRRTEEYFERYGGATVLLSRFIPIVRTCAPFVAGIGRMPFARFFGYNVLGGALWVLLFVWGGYLFGNVPWIHAHFGVVTLGVIALSLIPLAGIVARRPSSAPL